MIKRYSLAHFSRLSSQTLLFDAMATHASASTVGTSKSSDLMRAKNFVLVIVCMALALIVDAQNSKEYKADFNLVVGVQHITANDQGKIVLAGLQNESGSVAPYHYEFRAASLDGQIIASGTLDSYVPSSATVENQPSVSVELPGVYWVIVADSSNPVKRKKFRVDMQIIDM